MNAPVKAKAEIKQDPKADGLDKAPERGVRQLEANRIFEAEFKRTTWVATAHEGTLPEDLLKPDYWAHIAEKLRPFDKVEVRADDGTWYAEYLVLEVSRVWARVYLLNEHGLTSADVSLSQSTRSDYEITFRGPERQWSVIRRSDREVIVEGKQTESAAYEALALHLKV